jgi:hypothetical protein
VVGLEGNGLAGCKLIVADINGRDGALGAGFWKVGYNHCSPVLRTASF